MLRYFARLDAPMRVLWCYLIWYVAVVALYFDPLPNLWMSSAGIGILIGYALTLAAGQKGRGRDKWVVFRLYMFPFCVSSYSALIKGKGFFLLFPTEPRPLAIAIGACVLFIAFTLLCRILVAKKPDQSGMPRSEGPAS